MPTSLKGYIYACEKKKAICKIKLKYFAIRTFHRK